MAVTKMTRTQKFSLDRSKHKSLKVAVTSYCADGIVAANTEPWKAEVST